MLTTLLLFLASPALAIPAAALLDTQQGPPVCRVKIGTCGGGDFSLLFTKCACDCLGGQCDKVGGCKSTPFNGIMDSAFQNCLDDSFCFNIFASGQEIPPSIINCKIG